MADRKNRHEQKEAAPKFAQKKDKIGAWIDAGADSLKALAQKHDADGPMLDRALEIVRQFITQRSLILYGGMALDCALRLRGGRIYPDDERPDYDVMSSRSVDDAYDLAEILRSRGFVNVGAIRAVHAQTMRVRTDFQTVADISYAPKKVFENMPTVEFRGMRVLHPNYQRMDMHLAFCYPFKGAPREDVFHRWKKDLKRFNLVEKFWPISGSMRSSSQKSGDKKPDQKIKWEVKLPKVVLTNCALNGITAYFVFCHALRELCESLVKNNMIEPQIAKSICFEIKERIETIEDIKISSSGDAVALSLLSVKTTFPLVLMSGQPVETTTAISDVQTSKTAVTWFYPYMDARPDMAEIKSEAKEPVPSPNIQVYSTEHKLLSTTVVKISGFDVFIATPQAVLLWFLFEYHLATDEDYKNTCIMYYQNILNIINAACKLLAASKFSGDPETALKFINTSPFFLPTRTLGTSNLDEASLIRIARTARDVGEIPSQKSEMGDIRRLLDGLPTDYYPEKRARPPQFDYSNVLFLRDGGPRAVAI